MKRLIVLIICLFVAVCLTGCLHSDKDQLLVGFGREDISPQISVPLRGYANPMQRWSTKIRDPLYTTCIAFTDGDGNTVLLFHNDLCSTPGGVFAFVREQISKDTGIPVDNIMVSATHTHSAPEQSLDSEDAVQMYNEYVEEKMVAAAKAALDDRKAAQMYTASTTLENMNFVRHYRMHDGTVAGDNFGNRGGICLDHVSDADNQMQLIRFEREGGKDVVLVNWQVHPLRASRSKDTAVSSDLVGAMRMVLEPEMDCYMAYFTGASGNISPTSWISEENITSNYRKQGAAMANAAILACQNMTQQETGNVQILRRDAEVMAKNLKRKITSYAFSVGDVAFVTAPYEMFDTNGKFIKENSPFAMTFVVTCANDARGYIASKNTYAYGGYEVEYSGYARGTAEALADGYVQLLHSLYPTRKPE